MSDGRLQEVNSLIEQSLQGDKSATSRLISFVERGDQHASYVVDHIYPHAINSFFIGVTGPPGAGKSTLVDRLIEQCSEEGYSVAIVAVDPCSTLSSGALLGDRVRINHQTKKNDFFFRSMSSKNCMGGLAPAAREASWILAASGRQIVIIETVGVGQSELDITTAADTVLVVLTPESGDAIQTMKAGLIEVADVFAINKSDRPGAETIKSSLENMLDRKHKATDPLLWRPPIYLTSSQNKVGISDLYNGLQQHKTHLHQKGLWQKTRKAQFQKEIIRRTEEAISTLIMNQILREDVWTPMIDQMWSEKRSPQAVARKIITAHLDKLLPGKNLC